MAGSTIVQKMNTSKYGGGVLQCGVHEKVPYTLLRSEFGTNIVLPLPENLQSQTGMDWQQEEVGIGKYIMMENKKAMQAALGDALPSSLTDAIDRVKSIGAGLGLKDIVGQSKEDIKQVYARTKSKSQKGGLKIAVNPRKEMLFTGMEFKSYSFNFMLVPYNQKESDIIDEVIKKIQKASVPSLVGQKMFMMYPESWWIEFYTPEGKKSKYFMKIRESVCTGVNINYTPQSDTTNLHPDNAPLAVELSLDFTEISIPTKETINEYYG